MADGKKPQKGGKMPEVNTAFDIPDDIYKDYCTPDEVTHGKETKNECKVRNQRIERRWAREWREYRYVTPKYMKKFALNPPCQDLHWHLAKSLIPPASSAVRTILMNGPSAKPSWLSKPEK